MGIAQESVLGPLQFSMNINDLFERCVEVGCQMYVDDTVIYTSARTPSKAVDQLTKSLRSVLVLSLDA